MNHNMSIFWALTLATCLFSCRKGPAHMSPEEANLLSETEPAVQTPVKHSVGANVSGYYEALPALYKYTSKRYPLIIALHGVDALGNGDADLPRVSKRSITRLLYDGKFPASFHRGEKEYSFIVISPQFKSLPSTQDINGLLNYVIQNYRIDTARIYIVGHSTGGTNICDYAVEYGGRIAAIVPISAAKLSINDISSAKIAAFNLPLWAFHNDKDSMTSVKITQQIVKLITDHHPNPLPRQTLFSSSGHDAWTKATDPGFKEGSENIYEWMLRYFR